MGLQKKTWQQKKQIAEAQKRLKEKIKQLREEQAQEVYLWSITLISSFKGEERPKKRNRK
jgi:hypothetical protein